MFKTIIMTICIFSGLFHINGVFAGTVDPKLTELVASSDPEDSIAVIIDLISKFDLKNVKQAGAKGRAELVKGLRRKAATTQQPLAALLAKNGITDLKQLWVNNALAVSVPAGLIYDIAARPEVEIVKLDAVIVLDNHNYGYPPAAAEWNLAAVHADELWAQGITGEGVVVGSMDTGVDINHPDLGASWRGGSNSWFDLTGKYLTPYDTNGHGTQTTSIIVGGSAGGSSIGMAPGAHWIAAKIFDDNDQATVSGIHAAFQWMLDPDGNPDTDDAPNVVNNSWNIAGINECNTEFQGDIDNLRSAGIDVVFSAGNGGPSSASSQSPANNAGPLAAGAVDESMTVIYASARGPSSCDGGIYPQLTAPGSNIRTADLTFGGAILNSYAYTSGTSYAVAHLSGALVLLHSSAPNSSVAEREAALKQSAIDAGVEGDDQDYGWGLLDVAAANDVLNAAASPLPPPTTDADADGYNSDVDCNDSDASINPGATEIKKDGIDQDCNGYDLTIDITKAEYNAKRDKLSIRATSDLGSQANLTLMGYGSMKWSKKKAYWSISVRGVKNDPGTVTVQGKEGSETSDTR